MISFDDHYDSRHTLKIPSTRLNPKENDMSASQIDDLINPARLRLGIKRAFTGDVHEILCELIQNSARAGARNICITTDDRGFTYQDDGRGLRDESDFQALLKLGDSGWNQRVQEAEQPL